jgi:hypothetical protein
MWFDCEEWGYVYCPLMPLAQAGEPTNLYGHRVGVYVYTCEEGYEYGYDAETTVIVEGEDSAPVCQHVPYVGVGGTQVPGTGETHCTEDVRGTRSVDTSVPRLIPAAGLVVIYPCPNPALECQGWEAGYMYTSFWTVSATCWNSGGGMSNGLTEYGAYTRVDDVWIYQLQCDAPRWS